MSEPVSVAMSRLLGSLSRSSEDTRICRRCRASWASPRPGKGCHTEYMSRIMTRSLLGLGTVLALLGAAGPAGAPAAAQLFAPETLDRNFRLEWSRAGRNLRGFVYNTGNRRAARMI